MMRQKIRKCGWLILPFVVLILGYAFPLKFFDSLEKIRDFVAQFGLFAPVAFLVIQILQVLIPPISHQTVSLLGGVLFGFNLGLLYNWLGRIAGSVIAFSLSRKYGRPLVRKTVSERTFKKFESVVQRGCFLILLMYALPFFPDDEISYILGLSRMSLGQFLLIVLLGHIPGSLFAAGVGSGFFQKSPKTFFIAFAPSILFFFIVAGLVKSSQKIKDEQSSC